MFWGLFGWPDSCLYGVVPLSTSSQIIENLTTGVVAVDRDLVVCTVNPAAEMIFESSAKQMIGQPIARFWPDIGFSLEQALRSGHSFTRRDARLSLLGRDVRVDLTVTALLGRGGNGADGLVLEIHAVDRLRRLAHDEEMVDHHQAQRLVVQGLAHEIKNPLGGLRGAAQLLERQLGAGEREYTRVIIREADRLQALVDRLSGPTRPYRKTAVNIHQIFEHVRSLMLAEVGPGVDLKRDYDPSLPELDGDPDQLVQAVLNLVRNSVEAMRGAGTIWLRSRIERQFTIGQRRHRQVLRAEVEDTGPGVPPALRETLFYPMVTGRAEGTGLGLSIAQDIVRRHDGLIEYQSEPGRTVFTLFLPFEVRT